MNDLVFSLIGAIIMGLGATVTFDGWAWLLKKAFQIPPSNICLVGRWLGYMPVGTFRHANIGSTPPRQGECRLGWIAHYSIGITFAMAFVALVGSSWLRHPTLVPALLFGIVTVLAPLFIMQPLMGYGIAASRAPDPLQARLRSLMNHTAFGVGLYFFGWLANGLLHIIA